MQTDKSWAICTVRLQIIDILGHFWICISRGAGHGKSERCVVMLAGMPPKQTKPGDIMNQLNEELILVSQLV